MQKCSDTEMRAKGLGFPESCVQTFVPAELALILETRDKTESLGYRCILERTGQCK